MMEGLGLMLAQDVAPNSGLLMWAFILVGVTLVLLLLELFVPSGGLVGILAGVTAIASVVAFFKYDTTWGVVAMLAYVLLGPIVVTYGFKLWLHSPLAKRMILGGTDPEIAEAEDDVSPMSPEHAKQERHAQLRQLIGAHGQTITQLRPVGTIRINGRRLDAMAETGVIDAGTDVVVVEVYDNQIKVRPV